MKKLLVFLLPVVLMACQRDFHNEISGKPFPAQQARQGPLDNVTLDSIAKGWVDTTLIHVENGPNGPVNVYSINDVIVTVKKTGYQNWTDFWKASWRVIGWFIGFIIMVGSLVKFILKMDSGGAKNAGDTSPMAWILLMFVGAIMVATTTYPWSDEMDVPKAIYDNNQAADGDQHALDWNHAQSY